MEASRSSATVGSLTSSMSSGRKSGADASSAASGLSASPSSPRSSPSSLPAAASSRLPLLHLALHLLPGDHRTQIQLHPELDFRLRLVHAWLAHHLLPVPPDSAAHGRPHVSHRHAHSVAGTSSASCRVGSTAVARVREAFQMDDEDLR